MRMKFHESWVVHDFPWCFHDVSIIPTSLCHQRLAFDWRPYPVDSRTAKGEKRPLAEHHGRWGFPTETFGEENHGAQNEILVGSEEMELHVKCYHQKVVGWDGTIFQQHGGFTWFYYIRNIPTLLDFTHDNCAMYCPKNWDFTPTFWGIWRFRGNM